MAAVERPGDDHAGHDHAPGEGHDDHSGHDHAPGAHGGHSHGGIFGERTELIFAVLSGVCVALGWSLDTFASRPRDGPVRALPRRVRLRRLVHGPRGGRLDPRGSLRDRLPDARRRGRRRGARRVVRGRRSCCSCSRFGHALEGYAMGRARRAIEALGELAPATATCPSRRRPETEVPVDELRVGDTVVVRPDERIAGRRRRGRRARAPSTRRRSRARACPSTSSPRPTRDAALADADGARARAPRLRGHASTASGALDIVVTRTSSGETTLARVVQMVAEAETEQSPTQQFTDRFERVFVPAVLALVGLLLVGPPLLGALGVITEAFSRLVLPRDGGPRRREPVRARHRDAECGPLGRRAGGPERRARQGRRAARGARARSRPSPSTRRARSPRARRA